MIRRLAHVCIHTIDLDATRDFYVNALGLEIAFEFERAGEPFGFYVRLGEMTFIEVFKGQPSEVGNIKHLAIEVSDLDAVTQRLNEHGIETSTKKRGSDQSWQAWATDPNGVRIEFQE